MIPFLHLDLKPAMLDLTLILAEQYGQSKLQASTSTELINWSCAKGVIIVKYVLYSTTSCRKGHVLSDSCTQPAHSSANSFIQTATTRISVNINQTHA